MDHAQLSRKRSKEFMTVKKTIYKWTWQGLRQQEQEAKLSLG